MALNMMRLKIIEMVMPTILEMMTMKMTVRATTTMTTLMILKNGEKWTKRTLITQRHIVLKPILIRLCLDDDNDEDDDADDIDKLQ